MLNAAIKSEEEKTQIKLLSWVLRLVVLDPKFMKQESLDLLQDFSERKNSSQLIEAISSVCEAQKPQNDIYSPATEIIIKNSLKNVNLSLKELDSNVPLITHGSLQNSSQTSLQYALMFTVMSIGMTMARSKVFEIYKNKPQNYLSKTSFSIPKTTVFNQFLTYTPFFFTAINLPLLDEFFSNTQMKLNQKLFQSTTDSEFVTIPPNKWIPSNLADNFFILQTVALFEYGVWIFNKQACLMPFVVVYAAYHSNISQYLKISKPTLKDLLDKNATKSN